MGRASFVAFRVVFLALAMSHTPNTYISYEFRQFTRYGTQGKHRYDCNDHHHFSPPVVTVTHVML